MAKTKLSSKDQYEFADWLVARLKGMIDSLYFQDTITEASYETLIKSINDIWTFAKNAAEDLEYK